jgi:phosphonate transport system substrate-binding protein
MFRRSFLSASLAAIAFSSLPFSAQAQAVKEISFGVLGTDSSQSLKADWQPMLDELQARTGLKVTAFFASDYAGLIEAMRYNKMHAAWLGNKSAMEAVDRASGEIFAQKLDSVGAGNGYYSVLITHKDSPYKSLEDVLKNSKSINFGNGDPNSTSGFLVPSYYVFAQNNVDPKTAFKAVRNGSHGTNLLAVANKQVDVATNNTDDLERLKEKSPEIYSNIRVIWKSPLIPADPLVWRKDLPDDVKAKIKGFFLAWGKTEQEKQISVKALKAVGFRESSNAQLVPIRQLELFRDKTKLEADASMPAAEKQAKIAEIDKKLADLGRQVAAAK